MTAKVHLAADDLQIGDVIVTDDGQEIPVLALERTADGGIVTNPGAENSITGWPWGHVAIHAR